MNRRVNQLLGLVLAGFALTRAASAQSTLENISVRKYQRLTQDCKNPAEFNASAVDYTTLQKIIDSVDNDTVLEIGDGAHNSAAIRYLFEDIARELTAKGQIRYYLEYIGKPGLTPLTRDLPIVFGANSLTEKQSALAFYDYMATLNDSKRAVVVSADNMEGQPEADGGFAYGSDELKNKFRIFWKDFIQNPFDIDASLKKQNLTADETTVFRNTAKNLITYHFQPGWDEALNTNIPIRLSKDPLVAQRIADDVKQHPNQPVVVIYGGNHLRNAPDSLSSQLTSMLPGKHIRKLQVVDSMVQVQQNECTSPSMIDGDDLIILEYPYSHRVKTPSPALPSTPQ